MSQEDCGQCILPLYRDGVPKLYQLFFSIGSGGTHDPQISLHHLPLGTPVVVMTIKNILSNLADLCELNYATLTVHLNRWNKLTVSWCG